MRYIDLIREEHKKHFNIRKLRRRTPYALEHLVRSLYKEIKTGTPILVEGANDVRALEAGFGPGTYLTIYRKRRTLRSILQDYIELFGRRQIVLTDIDKKGNKLADKISNIMYEIGAMPILKFRRILSYFNVVFVESLYDKAEEIRSILRLIDLDIGPWPEL